MAIAVLQPWRFCADVLSCWRSCARACAPRNAPSFKQQHCGYTPFNQTPPCSPVERSAAELLRAFRLVTKRRGAVTHQGPWWSRGKQPLLRCTSGGCAVVSPCNEQVSHHVCACCPCALDCLLRQERKVISLLVSELRGLQQQDTRGRERGSTATPAI